MADDSPIPRPDRTPAPAQDATGEVARVHETGAGAVVRVGDDVVRLAAPVAEAVHRLAGASDLVRLVPPEHLRSGVNSGALQYMQAKAGEKAIIVHRDGGQIAGHANVERTGTSVAQAAVAMQVLAAITQQYYLHEITTQLESLAVRTESIEQRQQNSALGKLLSIERSVAELRGRRATGLVEAGENQMLRAWGTEADGILDALSKQLELHFAKAPGADRRRAFITKRLTHLEGAPARDFEDALVAARVHLAIREELLARAASDTELDLLLKQNEQITGTVLRQLAAAAQPFADALARAFEHHHAPYLANRALDRAKTVTEKAIPNDKVRRVGGQILTAPGRYHPTVKLREISVGKAKKVDERKRQERIDRFARLTGTAQHVAGIDMQLAATEIEARRVDGQLEVTVRPALKR